MTPSVPITINHSRWPLFFSFLDPGLLREFIEHFEMTPPLEMVKRPSQVN